MRRARVLFFWMTLAPAFMFSRAATADVPGAVEISGELGYATKPDSGLTAMGLGVGARAGVELWRQLYAGLDAMNWFGRNAEDDDGGNGHAYQLGVDAGYGFHFGGLLLRPEVGAGEATFFSSDLRFGCDPSTPPCGFHFRSQTEAHLYVQPGLAVLYAYHWLQVGADARVMMLFGTTHSVDGKDLSSFGVSLIPRLEVGVRFE